MSDVLRPSATLSLSATKVLDASRIGHNRLLAALPQADFALLAPHLTETVLDRGHVLQVPDQPVDRVYFPYGGLVSLLGILPEGHAIDTASIGREGAIGLQAGLGAPIATSRAVVQIRAPAAQISAARFAEMAEGSKPVRDMVVHYSNVLLAQTQQLAACNAMHSAKERLCRWLAHARDRAGEDSLPFTQELLADLLGLRRTTVTMIAHTLHIQGVITVRRGRIEIRDIAALEREACTCCHDARFVGGTSPPRSTTQETWSHPERMYGL